MVEDDPTEAPLLEELLAATFVAERVEHVDTLEAALDRLRHEPSRLDVVLLDLGLPDATGLDAVRAVVDAAPELPIVVLTGHDDQEMALEAERGKLRRSEARYQMLVEIMAEATVTLDPARFCLELGETVIAREKVWIARLHDAGFRVLADDFGTGYSPFPGFRDRSFDGLKIDTPSVSS